MRLTPSILDREERSKSQNVKEHLRPSRLTELEPDPPPLRPFLLFFHPPFQNSVDETLVYKDACEETSAAPDAAQLSTVLPWSVIGRVHVHVRAGFGWTLPFAVLPKQC